LKHSSTLTTQALSKYSVRVSREDNDLKLSSVFGSEEHNFELNEDNLLLVQVSHFVKLNFDQSSIFAQIFILDLRTKFYQKTTDTKEYDINGQHSYIDLKAPKSRKMQIFSLIIGPKLIPKIDSRT
jgi:hypothetical protein